jgi:hypothetical protein
MVVKCNICSYTGRNLRDYKIHCLTNKHITKSKQISNIQECAPVHKNIQITLKDKETEDNTKTYKCDTCSSSYVQKCSLYRHKKTCNKNNISNNKEIENLKLKHELELKLKDKELELKLKDKDLEMSELKIQLLEKRIEKMKCKKL